MPQRRVNSVKKAFDILDILAFEDIDRKGISLTELSKRTGIKTNTLHNILQTMKESGYVEQNKRLLYLTGKRCTQIAVVNDFYMTQEIFVKINECVRELADKTGVGASFYVLRNGERINYTNILGNLDTKVDYSMLKKNNIYEYPSGKILLAYCSESERERIIAKNGYPNGIETRRELNAYIKQIRNEKYQKDETEDGSVVSYACEVMRGKKLLGSLGVYIPKELINKELEELMQKELYEAVKKMSKL